MPQKLKCLLSIAGSDPTGGAGIQADIRAGISLGLHVATAVTAVTAQNSKEFISLGIVNPSVLQNQLKAIAQEIFPDAIKIGMIGSIENAYIILDFIKSLPGEVPIVIDPVFRASVSQDKPMHPIDESKRFIDLMVHNIFPLATVLTPNLQELRIYFPQFEAKIESFSDFLIKSGINAVIITGGDTENNIIKDVLFEKDDTTGITHDRIDCRNLHGTGCLFSSLLASYLALGHDLKEAFLLSSGKTHELISQSLDYQLGNSIYGPININNYLY